MAEKSASSAKRESTSIPGEAIVASASAAMPQTDAESVPAANVGPAPDPAASEARSLRARQILAYRNGDLNGAIADLDKAIQFDPKFLAAAIKFDRAFAGVAGAKRIEKASRTKSAPKMARKPRFDQAAIATSVTPLSQRPAGAQDPSREERALRR